MKEFTIGKNEASQRLDKYLKKLLPQAGGNFLYKMLRKKNITLNHGKASGSEHLSEGDTVTVFFSDDTFEKFSGNARSENHKTADISGRLEIVYEDADILIINKPAGLLSQKSRPEDISANEWILQYLLDTGAVTDEELRTFRPAVCNRLDRNTSGLLIAGKTLYGLQTMSRQLKEREIAKYYRCIVCGEVKKSGRLKGYLAKKEKSNSVTLYEKQRPGSYFIETEYSPVKQYEGYTMLEVHLITGRTHQIRAHLSYMGLPIAGDPKYGNPKVNRMLESSAGINRQLLHAYRLVLPDATEVTAPLPEDFLRAEQYLLTGQSKTAFGLQVMKESRDGYMEFPRS